MAFQPPITIREALRKIHHNDYLLPAIQRDFVWKREQITHLFDSLLQGYPIGSFLFWKVQREHSRDFIFYEFMTDYHQRENRHPKRHNLFEPRAFMGVLDGQQRLTALNIGLRGSHAERLPRRWETSSWAYPDTHLYLGLGGHAGSNELGMVHDFRFLTAKDIQALEKQGKHWFQVSRIMAMDGPDAISRHLEQHSLVADDYPFDVLSQLLAVVQDVPLINYYAEESQDLDKVLNIFIRVNRGGTVLHFSDMLFSIATAQWEDIDAREAINRLVAELNDTGEKFSVDKDLVLKAGLVLADVTTISSRATTYNLVNMRAMEACWDAIAYALRLAIRLLADFGFSSQTLTANSVLIPVAYYLHRRGADDRYLDQDAQHDDRERIRGWVIRSLLKRGVWSSGPDQLLATLRRVIRENDAFRFPVVELESAMAQRGKGLRFEEEELQALLDMTSGERRVFTLLSLLYPGMDFRQKPHIDHFFPRSLFTRAKLLAAGVDGTSVETFIAASDRLPNLQLMDGAVNIAKKDVFPTQWMMKHYPDEGARDAYRSRHHLGNVPEDIMGFMDFFEARRDRMAQRLRAVLGLADA